MIGIVESPTPLLGSNKSDTPKCETLRFHHCIRRLIMEARSSTIALHKPGSSLGSSIVGMMSTQNANQIENVT